jgi:two-component system chemotaxis sensor kinase CheA
MDELIIGFISETNESLNILDADLVKFEREPEELETLKRIFRVMHTIKGTCGFLGLPRLEKVAHAGEDVLVRYRDGELKASAYSVTLILKCVDRIRSLINNLEANGVEGVGDDAELIQDLRKLASATDGVVVTPKSGDLFPSRAMELSEGLPLAIDTAAAVANVGGQEGGSGVAVVPVASEQSAVLQAGSNVGLSTASKLEPKLAEEKKSDAASANHSIRVNVQVLENMMNLVSEMVLTRNQLLQMVRGRSDSEFLEPLQRLSRVTSDLQEGVMKTRMQPIGNAWQKLPRIIRDLAIASGKKIDLQLSGAETELDRQILEMIGDPLLHMVRNSADHGLESPTERLAAGKPEVGTILLSAFHQGGHIIMEIKDDGRGLNTALIRRKIVERGLASANEVSNMPDHEVHKYIMHAGFSTAEKITNVSGRGVGMDVVRANIEKIGGTVDFRSVQGKGTAFTIKIPLTLAIVAALIVESGGERFAIPQIAVNELVSTGAGSMHKVEFVKGAAVLRLRGQLLPLIKLRDVLNLPDKNECDASDRDGFVVVTQVGNKVFGIVVDGIYDTEEIVVKPVAPMLKSLSYYSGNTILGDGSVIMIFDPNGVADEIVQIASASAHDAEDRVLEALGDKARLLLFSTGESIQKAVPLALVSRLEDFALNDLQRTGEVAALAQYRGKLIPIVAMSKSFQWKVQSSQPALVFSDRDQTMALAVEEILDIVDQPLNVQIKSNRPGVIGTAIIDGKTTDIIDVSYFMEQATGAWFGSSLSNSKLGSQAKSRVLLVDDSSFFRSFLEPYLSVAGFEVITAESSKRALELLGSGLRIEAILSDIEMPDIDGFGFAEAVQKDPKFRAIPMIALTSHTGEKYRVRGKASGFRAYLCKNEHNEIVRILKETINSGVLV